MTIDELRDYLKDLPGTWPVNIYVPFSMGDFLDGAHPINNINAIGERSIVQWDGVIELKGPGVFLELDTSVDL